MTLLTLELALPVQEEVEQRASEADAWYARQAQRARQGADLARLRYRQVDPHNRLVADVLETEWSAYLRALEKAQQDYERKRSGHRRRLEQGQRERILALATDLPACGRIPRRRTASASASPGC